MSVLRRNIVWLFLTQALTWMISIVLLILTPRKLDAEGFGQLQFALAFVGFFGLVGSLGSSPYMVRIIARDPATLGPLVKSAIRLKLVLGTGLSLLALGLGWALGYEGIVMALILVACAGMILSLLSEVISAGLSGLELMATAARWQAAQVYLGSLAAMVVLLTNRSLVLLACCVAFAWVLPIVANYRTLRPHMRTSDPRVPWKPMIKGGIPLVALTVLNLIYGTIDIPILEWVSGAEVVGWYGLAYRWVSMPIFIVTIVMTAFYPSMSALAAKAPDEFSALTNRALRMVTFVSIPASIGMIVVADDLLTLLYGNKYDESVVLMQILAVHIPLAAIDTLLATALIASDRQNRYIIVSAVAAITNPPLAFAAIHFADGRYDNGAIGAATVTVATELFIMICAIRMRPANVIDRHTLVFILRCCLAGAAIVVAGVILKNLGLFVKVAAGSAVYAGGSLALGTVSPDRLRRVLGDFRRARGGAVDDGSEMSNTGADR